MLAHRSFCGRGVAMGNSFEQVAVLFGDDAQDDGRLDHGGESRLEHVDGDEAEAGAATSGLAGEESKAALLVPCRVENEGRRRDRRAAAARPTFSRPGSSINEHNATLVAVVRNLDRGFDPSAAR